MGPESSEVRNLDEDGGGAATGSEATGRADADQVVALGRGLEILECFRVGERHLGNQDIAKRTGLPKATVSRLTRTLVNLGYLAYSEALGKYRLGNAVLPLGFSLLSSMEVRHVARPFMHALADYAQAAVSFGVRDRLTMVYVENCQGNALLTLRLDVGSVIPLATTAMGRAYLCAVPASERDLLMDQLKAQYSDQWPKVKAGLEQAARDFHERGFCVSAGNWQQDIHAVGVPLVLRDGMGILGFNCGGPAFQLRRPALEEDLGPRLVNLVRNVEAALGQR
jgi:DNA-binding IclR family transcriptional regulator